MTWSSHALSREARSRTRISATLPICTWRGFISSSPLRSRERPPKCALHCANSLLRQVNREYHETITLFWVRLLAHARAIASKESLENVVEANPQLLEKDFPFAYYSRERLFSENARTKWMEPDLKPLSADAIAPCSSRPPCNAQNRALSR